MFKEYVRERFSWIALFICLQLLGLCIAYIDTALSVQSFSYYSFLSCIIFVIFLWIRYQKETAFFKELQEREDDIDITSIPISNSPFEKIAEGSITNQAKRLSEEIAEKSLLLEQEKDQLLSWIHEVKTPLTAMRLMLDRIEDPSLKSALTYEWLRVHLLLDQQLHQKRLLFIENDLYIEQVELEEIIFHEIKELQAWCMQKGIGFDVEMDEQKVLSDGKWLGFIVRQLLTNAVKYSEESDIIIRSLMQDGQTLLTVQDFGRGIALTDLPRIFDKGFTATRKQRDHAATGMGLYLAEKAAQSLGIQISVTSKLGEGTTFTLTFSKKNDFVGITGM